MITAKFGGTAITPRNLVYLKKILTPSHKVVVVSAIGKSHPNDIKTTDLLATYFRTGDQAIWQTICQRYTQLVDVNCVNINVDVLLADAYARALKFDLDYCMSLGEELSAKIVARFLNATYIEAQDVVCFGSHTLDVCKTLSRLKSAIRGEKLAVIGGFYGGRADGRKTFSRGGSDVTASFCARATSSSLCENWTDANGVCQGNPTEIFGVKTISHLSYNQMYQLAQAGATVLHPDAVKPLQKMSIPLVVGNFYNPNAPKTVVSNNPNNQKLLCVTQKKADDKFVVTVVHNMQQNEVFHCLDKLTKRLDRAINSTYSSAGQTAQLTTAQSLNNLQVSQSAITQTCANPITQHLVNCSIKHPFKIVTCQQNTVTIVCNDNILQQIFDAFSNTSS